jgi:hypothetical protein
LLVAGARHSSDVPQEEEWEMLFQITHVHTNDSCPGVVPEIGDRMGEWWQALKANPDVKLLAGYVSPMNHTFHITVEAADYGPVARAFGPLNEIGEGDTTPVITLDQAFPMADEGAFRLPED